MIIKDLIYKREFSTYKKSIDFTYVSYLSFINQREDLILLLVYITI